MPYRAAILAQHGAEVSDSSSSGILRPYAELRLPLLQCFGLGVVPKKGGKWRVIMHLLAPVGSSINDHISREQFSPVCLSGRRNTIQVYLAAVTHMHHLHGLPRPSVSQLCRQASHSSHQTLAP